MYRPKKSLGQNFLRDENILRKIAESVNISIGDVVIEIGPGQGALTKHLLNKPINLIAIEVDKRSVQLLKERYGEKVQLIHRNILDVDLKELTHHNVERLHIVGNIPYNLTSEILFWLFDSRSLVSDATLMVQFEVARRLVALPRTKDYGILSVFTQFYTDCNILFKVSRNCFFPKPEVDSAVIQLNFNKHLPECNEQLFRSIVRSTFGKRRKTLRNGLKSLDFDDEVLDQISFDLTRRPEELSVFEFLELTNTLCSNTNIKEPNVQL